MIKNYLTIAMRNFRKHFLFSLMNVFGLSLGLASAILIFLWVQNEVNYDLFNKNYPAIHRITAEATDMQFAVSPAPLAPAMQATIAEVKNATRLNATSNLFEVNDVKYEEKNGFFAEPSFFEIFSYPLLEGNARTALSATNGIVLTEKLAKKYFPNRNIIGRSIRIDNQDRFVVTGLLKDVPTTSHLQFDYLLPLSYLEKLKDPLRFKSWRNVGVYSYVELEKDADISNIQKELNSLYKKNESEMKIDFQLQPLSDIHLNSKLLSDVSGQGNIQYVKIFSFAAFFILLVACINFINLSTARSAIRAKEVGVRKVIGADRGQLIAQFLSESFFTSILALIVALVLVEYLLPSFNNLSGKDLHLNFGDQQLLLGLAALTTSTGLIAGFYPALFLSSFKTSSVLKQTIGTGKTKSNLRSTLVVLQFAIAAFLISGTIIIYRQVQFIKTRNLGFDKENLLYVPLKGDLNHGAFKDALSQNPLTSNFTQTFELPGNLSSASPASWPGSNPEKEVLFYNLGIDQNFINTFKIQLLTGRNFTGSKHGNEHTCIINERAAAVMGFSPASAIGKQLIRGRDTANIAGVIKDFNYKPLHTSIEPLVLEYSEWGNFIVIKTQPDQTEKTIAALKKIWQKAGATTPFESNFLDQDLNRLYLTEERIIELSKAFALLAILVSCIGLYGLVTFAAEQRVKEIGIRKALGASTFNITTLLSANLIKLILISLAIAGPISWHLMNQWLQNFAYRIQIEWWMLGLAGAVSIGIALVTVSYRCINASLTNPIKSLRTE